MKAKSKSGVKKRFFPAGPKKNRRLKRRKAYRNHILEKKAVSRKRRLRTPGTQVHASDAPGIWRMLTTQ